MSKRCLSSCIRKSRHWAFLTPGWVGGKDVGCWMLSDRCWLLASGCYLLAAGCWLGAVIGCGLLLTAGCRCCWLLACAGKRPQANIASKMTISPRRNAFRQPFGSIKLIVFVNALNKNVEFRRSKWLSTCILSRRNRPQYSPARFSQK